MSNSHTSSEADPGQRVIWALRKAELVVQSLKEQNLRPTKMSGAQYALLASIQFEPGLSGAELARRVGVTPQAVGAMLSKLETQGLVERRDHPRHGHIHEFFVSEPGLVRLADADAAISVVENRVRDVLGGPDAEQLRLLLDRVVTTVCAIDAPDTATTESSPKAL